jgi:hypothetical protein
MLLAIKMLHIMNCRSLSITAATYQSDKHCRLLLVGRGGKEEFMGGDGNKGTDLGIPFTVK